MSRMEVGWGRDEMCAATRLAVGSNEAHADTEHAGCTVRFSQTVSPDGIRTPLLLAKSSVQRTMIFSNHCQQ